jgi:anti-sigma regulatory factor (Ser/Thr protein kinase)
MKTSKEFVYSSDLCRLDDLYRDLDELFAGWNLPTEPVEALRVCISEAVTNAIIHAHKGESSKQIRVRVELDSKIITVDVEDQGSRKGISALQSFEPTYDPDAEGGRGLVLMKQLTDDFMFFAREDGGLTVRLVKFLQKERNRKQESGRI